MSSAIGSARHCRHLAEAYLGFFTTGRVHAYPSRIHLQTQTRCNAACAMCPYPSVSREWTHGTMSRELFEQIVGELSLAPRGTTLTVSLQNEPLLKPDILEWFVYAGQRAPQVRRVLTTNGALLHRFATGDIKAARLGLISVSLNAHTRQTYEQLNCGLDFDTVVADITRLADEPDLRPVLRLDFVETELNTSELGAARTFWANRGVATYVEPLRNRAGALKNYGVLATRGRPGAADAKPPLLAWLRRQVGCPQPFYEMSVLHNGDAILCCHDWHHSCIVGNVADTSIRDVWNAQALRNMRQSQLSGHARTIEPCAGCSLA